MDLVVQVYFGLLVSVPLLVSGDSPYQCPYPVSAAPVDADVVQEHRQYSRQLYKRMKMWELKMIHLPRTAPRKTSNLSTAAQSRSFSLLELALEATKSACPTEYVSHEMLLEGAMNAFHFLLNDNILGEYSGYKEEPLSKQQHHRIEKILYDCQENLPEEKFSFAGSTEEQNCPNSLIRKICQNSEEDVPICKRLKSNKGKNECFDEDAIKSSNFILDVIWSMVNLVHGACAMEFRKADDLTSFHAWEQAMEQLFSRKVRKYWYHPGMSLEEYQAILHPSLIQQIHNLEMCVEGIYYLRTSNRTPRLQRPPYSFSAFRKRKRRSISMSA